MEQAYKADASPPQVQGKTPMSLIRGVVVRVMIASVPVAALVWAMIYEFDRLYQSPEGLDVSALSILGAFGVLRFISTKLQITNPSVLIVSGVLLIPVVAVRLDVIPFVPFGVDISFLSILGIVVAQHPFAVFLLWYYQRSLKNRDERIRLKLQEIRGARQ